MIQFSPDQLTDQRFVEAVTILQNPIPQRGSFPLNLKLMDPEDAMSGPEARPAEAEGLLMGRREGRHAEHGEVTSWGFQHHEQGTAVPFTPDNHLVMQGSYSPSPSGRWRAHGGPLTAKITIQL